MSAIIHDSRDYRIEAHRGLPKRFSVDYKDRSNGRVCLVNLGWCDWRHQAFQMMNAHLLEQLDQETRQ